MSFKIIETRVRELLEQYPITRDNDHLLYTVYIETYHYKDFNKDTFINYKEYGLPSFKSVERCRRRIQNEYGYAESSEEIQEQRKYTENKYVECFTLKEDGTISQEEAEQLDFLN